MKLFGRFDVFRRDAKEEKELVEELEEVSKESQATQQRLDRIIDIEKVRLRNLELRAEVMSRSQIHRGVR
jgi:hypothetical protein